MIRTEKLRFCKGDWLAVSAVIVLAFVVMLCFLPASDTTSSYAEVYLNGERIKTVNLTEDQTFVVEERYCNVIKVADGAVCIAESNCPGQDCVHSGSIRAAGRVLVCLPNGLEIRVTSAEADVDFVVR